MDASIQYLARHTDKCSKVHSSCIIATHATLRPRTNHRLVHSVNARRWLAHWLSVWRHQWRTTDVNILSCRVYVILADDHPTDVTVLADSRYYVMSDVIRLTDVTVACVTWRRDSWWRRCVVEHDVMSRHRVYHFTTHNIQHRSSVLLALSYWRLRCGFLPNTIYLLNYANSHSTWLAEFSWLLPAAPSPLVADAGTASSIDTCQHRQLL